MSCYGLHRDLHSFPTRRSSDLISRTNCAQEVLPLVPVIAAIISGWRGENCAASAETARRMSGVVTIDIFAMDAVPSGASTDRKSTRLNSSHVEISYAVFCLKKK